ncbi:hypothetical protein P6144_05270 [Sphingomonas sp. HITSZ_GF]|uniref:hypothetical protein n=1 Tax=Sphingomonas sp. HITSZ_GF TaxID=3037247 RepID=UPI00240D0F4A|nr:hypothetical protein [Sphingomonas sp. HITSZ_GF]MDG2533047.1 hypothetical protein [Sphingomonas sp. HITSZ_GF]
MPEPSPPDLEAAVQRMARLVDLDIPVACLPGVIQSLEAFEMHLGVLRAAEGEREG